jgi:hypothetical protein
MGGGGVTQFGFTEQLRWSQGVAANVAVEDILLSAIAGAREVRRATTGEDRTGTDWWVDLPAGHSLSVDLKARAEDWKERGEDDLALETWSVVEREVLGWSLDLEKRTDYILWWWKNTGRWCLVPFPMLRTVCSELLEEWKGKYKTRRQSTEGRYHSECVFVPRRVVWAAIYKRFA